MKSLFCLSSITIWTLLSFMPLAHVRGQNLPYAKSITNLLCASDLHGRGYVKKGDIKAASLIRKEFRKFGLTPYTDDFYQRFTICVNTFPGAMSLEINGKALIPGIDFMIDPSSSGCKGKFEAKTIPVIALAEDSVDALINASKGKVLVIDSRAFNKLGKDDKDRVHANRKKIFWGNELEIIAIIEITEEKLSYGISPVACSVPYFRVKTSACPDKVSSVIINARSKFLDNYETRNVAGFIRGRENPDSMILFTAHFDHLGMMGSKTFFPGANDNSSGIAMLLVLAEHFAANPPRCSVVFLAFSGEEIGMLGSNYFTQNPLVELSRIKFLINLDLVGNGAEGITVVNGSLFPEYFSNLSAINNEGKLLPYIKKRGEACNSDHCPFYKRGVPCFFIYTMGGTQAYHDLNDSPESLTYDGFDGLTKLLIEFVKKF